MDTGLQSASATNIMISVSNPLQEPATMKTDTLAVLSWTLAAAAGALTLAACVANSWGALCGALACVCGALATLYPIRND